MSAPAYKVLARKYRPQSFTALIGQDAMVRTLKNAITGGRLAHAFILTGVRGVGKTTTARLIARALNCVGIDGKGQETVEPCGQCQFCKSIAESREPDVIEMDAASHTGVDDIRAIIDNVRYASAAARYKIYIIDEVHMLSKNAFNALLKTLEEPPAHVKFIFATTEIRKVPVTVLSRCQRFDLKRVEIENLIAHFRQIAAQENVEIDDAALSMIARASEGSVRDGLSLLDQAFAHGDGKVTGEQVRAMIGLADRAAVIELYAKLMEGKSAAALEDFSRQYEAGAEPLQVIEEMLAFTHWLTRLKLSDQAFNSPEVSEVEKTRGRELADALNMAALTRNWQLLLKGIEELRLASDDRAAAEMLLIRLGHAASLPSPADLVRKLQEGGMAAAAPASPKPSNGGGNVHALNVAKPEEALAAPQNFTALVALFEARKEGLLGLALRDHVHLVRFEEGRLEIRPKPQAPRDLAPRVMLCLEAWTGKRWQVVLSNQAGEATLGEQLAQAEHDEAAAILAHPEVKKVFEVFPGARVVAVRRRQAVAEPEAPLPNTAEDID